MDAAFSFGKPGIWGSDHKALKFTHPISSHPQETRGELSTKCLIQRGAYFVITSDFQQALKPSLEVRRCIRSGKWNLDAECLCGMQREVRVAEKFPS